MAKERKCLEIIGIVQGVGFRPFIYRLAKRHNLKGFVLNNTKGVIVELEGEGAQIEEVISKIKENPPPLAQIEKIECESLPVLEYRDFEIRISQKTEERNTLISPDIATCEKCKKELLNPDDRRYRYPFINCINCGPRFTIIRELPYDRKNTTMKKFKMCEDCRLEYDDPANRRFHAQPDACPVCGPEVRLVDRMARVIKEEPISKTIELLGEGKIVAIKGLGGFHLACNAKDKAAVSLLRERKGRPSKPLALMAGDVEVVRKYAYLSKKEEELLSSSKSPILLLLKREENTLPEEIAPGNRYIGFMLPYTPLHILLFQDPKEAEVLVMTSGNKIGEPIIIKNIEAIRVLGGIADYFLLHNRDIRIPSDDSVVAIFENRPIMIRRSRGYVPKPIKCPAHIKKNILGCGAHLKNTFSLARGNEIFTSHHIGDLGTPKAMEAYERGIKHFESLFDIHPEVIVVDRHPEYLSTKFGEKWADENDSLLMRVQHHHAHIASCLVDNDIDKEVIGIAWDGTGFGEDGAIWGGEFLIAGFKSYQRKAHFEYIPLPGGEKAVKEPWRMATTYLYYTMGEDFLDLDIEFIGRLDLKKWEMLKVMIDRKINAPLTSSAGRLFDAVSSLLDLRDRITYLGQAAIELEMIIEDDGKANFYNFKLRKEDGIYIINAIPVIRSIIDDLIHRIPPSVISARFHKGLIEMIADITRRLRDDTGITDVALSGGVFQNRFLLQGATKGLIKEGFRVYTHHNIPPNDGGISVGQVAIAANVIP